MPTKRIMLLVVITGVSLHFAMRLPQAWGARKLAEGTTGWERPIAEVAVKL